MLLSSSEFWFAIHHWFVFVYLFACFSVLSSRFLKYILSVIYLSLVRELMWIVRYIWKQETLVYFQTCPILCMVHKVLKGCCSGDSRIFFFFQNDHPGSKVNLWTPSSASGWLLRPSNRGKGPPKTCRIWQSTQRHGHPGWIPATQVNTKTSKTESIFSVDAQNNQ